MSAGESAGENMGECLRVAVCGWLSAGQCLWVSVGVSVDGDAGGCLQVCLLVGLWV